VRVSVFGLGYVGVVTVCCLARNGHQVVGVDVNADKVAEVVAGRPPIVEPGLEELLGEGVAAGRITATTDAREAVLASDLTMITVGTPSRPNGEPNLDYLFRVCDEIASALESEPRDHVVVVRSTAPPGTLARCRERFDAAADAVHLAFNPEFLREGSAIADFDGPPYTVIGTEDPAAERALRELYAGVSAPLFVVRPEVAEMVKYVANAWHAAKIVFANEVGRLAEAFGVDGREVMGVIVEDKKLNVSATYMRPGFAYGGSCLPKDVSGLLHLGRRHEVPVPLLASLPVSNAAHIELATQAVLRHQPARVAVLGLAFKPGTDDLRESPAVPLVKKLLGEGCQVSIFDRHVRPARLTGANLAYIRAHLPHFEALLSDEPEEVLAAADVVVVTHSSPEIVALAERVAGRKPVVDLAGAMAPARRDA
jgi:GDP-mannose 6-dehydrogenase